MLEQLRRGAIAVVANAGIAEPDSMLHVITGGAGFVASGLIAAIAETPRPDILVIDSFLNTSPRNIDGSGARILQLDLLLDGERIESCLRSLGDDIVVYHMAALHYLPWCMRAPARTMRTNLEASRRLMSILGSLDNVSALILASTAAVYAPSTEPHMEEGALGPIDVYGDSKQRMEQAVADCAAALGQRTRVARLFNVIGPRETNPHLLPETIAQLKSAPLACAELRLGNLTTVRDYVDVRDVGRALLSMALGIRSSSRDVPFALNLGSAEGVSGEQLVRSVAEVADREVAVRTDPARLRPSDRPRLVADIRRARSALGWSPTIDLRQSLRDAIAHPHAVSYGRAPELGSA